MNFIRRNIYGQITDGFGKYQGMMNMHCQLFAVWQHQYLLLVKIF